MAREVGLSNLTLFPLTTDIGPGTVPTYGAAFKLPWAVSFETENEYAEGQYYGDNIVETSKRQLSKMGVTMEVSSDTPPELDAKITGKEYKLGASIVGVGQATPYHAVAYEISMDDGNLRRRIIYKVPFSRNGQTNVTQEDSMEGQTYTYEGTAIPLVSINKLELTLDLKAINAIPDEDKKTKVLELWNNFFTKVILPAELDKIV